MRSANQPQDRTARLAKGGGHRSGEFLQSIQRRQQPDRDPISDPDGDRFGNQFEAEQTDEKELDDQPQHPQVHRPGALFSGQVPSGPLTASHRQRSDIGSSKEHQNHHEEDIDAVDPLRLVGLTMFHKKIMIEA